MPLISQTTYRPPGFLQNGHALTVFPVLFRRVNTVSYTRERISTPDGDFLDLDWSVVGAPRLAVIAHGLEGHSRRGYVMGMARALNKRGWDAVAWNFRGCSGEPNWKLRFYHSGDTQDLDTVLQHVLHKARYDGLALVGFSMGGNIVLKYLGERGAHVPDGLQGGVAFSVPCDLSSGASKMARPANSLYMRRFLSTLHAKVRGKMERFPGMIHDEAFHHIKTFEQFDGTYTAPLHGFESAQDYWRKASSKPLLPRVAVPTLLINALDDPFLDTPCFPYEEAQSNPCFYLETPKRGGHVGFVSFGPDGEYWSEVRAGEFLQLMAA